MAQLAAVLVVLVVCTVLVPGPHELVTAARSLIGAGFTAGGATVTDEVMLLLAGGVVWAVIAWTVLVLAAAAITRLPGAAGRCGRTVLRGLAPAAARRVLIAAVGTALIGGAAAACAAPPGAPAMQPGDPATSASSSAATRTAQTPDNAPAPRTATTSPAVPVGTGFTVDLDWPRPATPPAAEGSTPSSPSDSAPSDATPSDGATSNPMPNPATPAGTAPSSPDAQAPTPGASAAASGPATSEPAPAEPAPAESAASEPAPAETAASEPAPAESAASETVQSGTAPSPATASAPTGKDTPAGASPTPTLPDLSWPGTAERPAGPDAAGGADPVAGAGRSLPAPSAPPADTVSPHDSVSPADPDTAQPAAPTGQPVDRTAVTVRPGDSLWSLAQAHLSAGADEATVARATQAWYVANAEIVGDDPDLIQPGQVLNPPATDHPEDLR